MMATGSKLDDQAVHLAEVLMSLEHSTRRDAAKLYRNERNRTSLLKVHGGAALTIAPLFAISGHSMTGPNWELFWHIPWFPYSFAALLWLGGATLLVATLARNRTWEMVGLRIVQSWYLAQSVGFAWPVVVWLYHVLAGRPAGMDPPNFYAWEVHFHLAIIMGVHVWTLRRMGRFQIS